MIRKEAIIIGIVAWIILTLLFIHDQTATDGFVGVGFPLEFYRYAGKQTVYVDRTQLGFNFSNFILDLTILVALIYLINYFLGRNLKKIKPDKPTYL